MSNTMNPGDQNMEQLQANVQALLTMMQPMLQQIVNNAIATQLNTMQSQPVNAQNYAPQPTAPAPQSSCDPFMSMTMSQIISLPQSVQAAIFNNAMQSQTSQLDQLNERLAGIEQLQQMQQIQMWQNQNHHHHSTKHKVVKYGGIALGVGAVAYGVHKYKHRHDKEKIVEVVQSTTKAYIDAKYSVEDI